ncbi:MAG TPA: MFS transporter [Roseiarcus sp.]|nr:MFS transporter [Roseiarcus sp.]
MSLVGRFGAPQGVQGHVAPVDVAPVSGASVSDQATVIGILFAVSASHMLNDMMQSLAPALYPVFQSEYSLSFAQVGVITLVFQITASLLQPLIGLVADRRPSPRALPFGMGFTLFGLVLLAFAHSYLMLLVSVGFIGVGSAVFHPEASRAARAASGGRHGFAQSLFQVGGNFGQSLGPLMAAFIVVPHGQRSVLAFTALAFMAILLLSRVAQWQIARGAAVRKASATPAQDKLPRALVRRTLAILVVLLFSKMFYLASINSYYTFYLMQTFHLSVRTADVLLFVFMASVAAGTFAGGPIGDRIGRRYVIWGSILGVLPFTLLLPHLGLVGTVIDSVAIGLVLSSAFAAMVVYATELSPGNVGAIAGLFFGLSFGLGGLGAAALGQLADHTSLNFVYHVCAYLPAIGLLGYFLPDVRLKHG